MSDYNGRKMQVSDFSGKSESRKIYELLQVDLIYEEEQFFKLYEVFGVQ